HIASVCGYPWRRSRGGPSPRRTAWMTAPPVSTVSGSNPSSMSATHDAVAEPARAAGEAPVRLEPQRRGRLARRLARDLEQRRHATPAVDDGDDHLADLVHQPGVQH